VAVIIPALNEKKSIGLVLRDIPKKTVDWVILVDNGSTDRTAHVAESLGAIVTCEPEREYGAACLAGIKSLPVETDNRGDAGESRLCLFEGDGSPCTLPPSHRPLEDWWHFFGGSLRGSQDPLHDCEACVAARAAPDAHFSGRAAEGGA